MNHHRIFSCALDCITIFSSQNFPLKNIAQDLLRKNKLNSSERKIFLSLIFSWSREKFLAEDFLQKQLSFFSKSSVQEKNEIILSLLCEQKISQQIDALKNIYEQFKNNLRVKLSFFSLSPLFAERIKKDYPNDYFSIASGLLSRAKIYLAFDPSRINETDLLDSLTKAGINASKTANDFSAIVVEHDQFALQHLPKNIRDHIWVMDLSSQMIANLIAPKENEKVWDMCAGLGLKTRLLANSPGQIFATEIDQRRFNHGKKFAAKNNVHFICADALKAPFSDNYFDWILLDAPCSGSGVLRRNPDLMHRLTSDSIEQYKTLQINLLKSAIKHLKPGGKLIYATCSVFKEENHHQISSLLRSYKNIIPLNFENLLTANHNFFPDEKNNYFLQLFSHLHDCDALFVSSLIKTPNYHI